MITPEQRTRRREGIGSSDSPALCDVDPWKSRHDIYVEKVFETDDIEGNEAIDRGNDMESAMLAWAGRELGVQVEPNVERSSALKPLFRSNVDALVVGKREGLEAKTTNMTDEWGTPGTDQVPDRVNVQCQHHCYVHELDAVWVPVLMAKFDRIHREMYRVPRNEDIIDAIVTTGEEFWENHVIPKVPPENFTPSLEVLKRIKRTPQAVMTADDETRALLLAYLDAQADYKAHETAYDDAKARLIAAIGDAEALDYGDEKKWFTYLEQTRSGFDAKALKMEHPEIFEKYQTSTAYRVPRICNKPKGGK